MKKLIVGNLKMNLLTFAERDRYIESFEKELKGKKLVNSHIVLCPPSLHIENFANKLDKNDVSVGAQNVFWEERGSFTGEISPLMVKNFGAEYVIVGHSERRRYFGETNQQINAKIQAALRCGLSVIHCVGETKAEKDAGDASSVIASQLSEGLLDIPVTKTGSIVIAYEPVWAVGSDNIPSSDAIMEVKIVMKKILIELYGSQATEKILILYGGSVKAKTAQQVCLDPGMDGVLVGRESLIPMELLNIAEIIDKA